MSATNSLPSDQKRAEALVSGMVSRDGFSAWLDVELVEVRPAGCTLRMRVRADMLNGFGVCHGGITYSLADSALAFAAIDSWYSLQGRIAMVYLADAVVELLIISLLATSKWR